MRDEGFGLIGMSDYEARVYKTLLRESPATAYRLGKASGVPQSRVYDVANKLVEKGAAVVQPGEPTRFVAVSPDLIIDQARARALQGLDRLRLELSDQQSSSHSVEAFAPAQ